MKEKTFNEKIAEYNKGVDETPENILSPEMKEEAKEKFKQKLTAEIEREKEQIKEQTKIIEEAGYIICKKNKDDTERRVYNHKMKGWFNIRNLYNKGIPERALDRWLNDKNTGVYTLSMRPDKNLGKFLDEYGEDCWNEFEGWQIKPEKKDWSLIKDFLFRIICNSNNDDFEYLLKWISKIIANPGTKSEVGLALLGKQGTGKSTLFEIMIRIIGYLYCYATSENEDINGKFNGYLSKTILCFFDEAKISEEGYNKIKTWITQPSINIQQKGVNQIFKKNFTNFMLATNKTKFIPLEKRDRRWFVLEVSDAERGKEKYWNELYKNIDNEIEGFVNYLYELDVKRLEEPPLNEAKELQIENAESKIVSWFNKWIKSAECKEYSFISGTDKVIKASVIHNAFVNDPNGQDINIKSFIKEIEFGTDIKTKLIKNAKHFIITELDDNLPDEDEEKTETQDIKCSVETPPIPD